MTTIAPDKYIIKDGNRNLLFKIKTEGLQTNFKVVKLLQCLKELGYSDLTVYVIYNGPDVPNEVLLNKYKYKGLVVGESDYIIRRNKCFKFNELDYYDNYLLVVGPLEDGTSIAGFNQDDGIVMIDTSDIEFIEIDDEPDTAGSLSLDYAKVIKKLHVKSPHYVKPIVEIDDESDTAGSIKISLPKRSNNHSHEMNKKNRE